MAKAFKCDSCGEYADGEPMTLHMIPPSLAEKDPRYDLCPYCANEVIELVMREKVFGDLEE